MASPGRGWTPRIVLVMRRSGVRFPKAAPRRLLRESLVLKSFASVGPPSHGRGRAGRVGIGQGELIVCAGEMIAEESAIESPKPPREIRSNCFTARPW